MVGMINRLARWTRLGALVALCMVLSVAHAQVTITLDSTNLGTLTTDIPQTAFTFSAEAGQAVTIELISISAALRVQAVVFDDSGILVLALGNPDNEMTRKGDVILSRSATYLIQVSSSNGETGEFVLRLTGDTQQLCEQVMTDVIDTLDNVCTGIGRNQACYGNLLVEAQPVPELLANSPFRFSQKGDIEDVARIESFALSPLDDADGTWGVALLQVQADLPETLPGQNVRMLFFGDVQVDNSAIMDDQLAQRYRPMQAFYFQNGIGASTCNEVPDSGILIDTPNGFGVMEFSINEVVIQLGSTAFLNLSDQQTLDINMIEGTALVAAEGEAQIVTGGSRVRVPVDENAKPVAPPLPPESVELGDLIIKIGESVADEESDSGILPTPQAARITVTPEPTAITLPELPTTGACVLATSENIAVNVRRGPSTDFQAISALDSFQTYTVIGRTGDSSWWQISSGWAAGSVTRRGGDCRSVPVTYIPPTATPMPTVTPSLPIAGDNEFNITIDYNLLGQQHYLVGHISAPQGDRQDTVTYTIINLPLSTRMRDHNLSYSIRCDGTGVEYATMTFSDGSSQPCTITNSNFLDMGINRQMASITIGLNRDAQSAYVTWEMSFSVIQ